MTKINSVRSGIGFFLTTLAGAYLGAIGGRLAGLFGPAETLTTDSKLFGLYLLIAFIVLVVGMGLRRMDGTEIRSALLGAASVLISIPVSRLAVTGGPWDDKAVGMATLGLMFFGVGMFAAFAFASRMRPASDSHDDE
jgi:hypothetical protein